jgi:tyrosyl-tRNA synthetase
VTRFAPGPDGLLADLRWRGMLHAVSDGLEARLARGGPISGYIGFDPTGPSLHIGHLVPVAGLLHLQRHGGLPVAIVGGGTGMIGDPSGRSTERNLLDEETLRGNVIAIRGQLERLLGAAGDVRIVDNRDWLGRLSMIEFLRDYGKHFTVPYMLAKDSVQTRLDRGLSFTEFSYMILQSIDFAHLRRSMGVEMQMGGADQWGNITAGLELIRRTAGEGSEGRGDGDGSDAAYGLAYPLLLSPSGAKFGKTEGGTSVWLDPALTTPFAFYQHWLNTDDRDVGLYLRWFTSLDPEAIEALEAAAADRPAAREAQRALAADVTTRVHGEAATRAAIDDAAALFGPEPIRDPDRLARLHASIGGFEVPRDAVGQPIAAVLGDAGVFPSRGEARRTIANGGVVINGEPVRDGNDAFPAGIAGGWWEVRIGRRRRLLGRLSD